MAQSQADFSKKVRPRVIFFNIEGSRSAVISLPKRPNFSRGLAIIECNILMGYPCFSNHFCETRESGPGFTIQDPCSPPAHPELMEATFGRLHNSGASTFSPRPTSKRVRVNIFSGFSCEDTCEYLAENQCDST